MESLEWTDIVFVTQMIMTHSECMRYGHFTTQDIPLFRLQRVSVTQAWRLDSDWTKYTDDNAVTVFFMDMPTAEPAIYRLDTPHAACSVAITASMVLSWYTTIRAKRFTDSPLLFPGMPPMNQRHTKFQSWLRQKITVVVPGFTLVAKVRPHGLRAGWVCDRRAQKVPDNITMWEGRWKSKQAMGLYDH